MSLPNLATDARAADAWLEAARVALVDLARQALGSSVAFAPGSVRLPAGLAGALVPIVSDLPPVQVGLFASDAGCEALTRALLGASSREPVTRAEVVDAIGEIVNMLAGTVKARIARYANHAALGLPTFVHGLIELQSDQRADVLPVTIGASPAFVIVLHTV